MLDWNDLRYFLAVAREGSTLAAARSSAHQPDDRRPPDRRARIRARLPAVRETPGRLRRSRLRAKTCVARAEQVDRAANGFAEASAAIARDTSGTVRITTQEIFAVTLLAPILRELHDRTPKS